MITEPPPPAPVGVVGEGRLGTAFARAFTALNIAFRSFHGREAQRIPSEELDGLACLLLTVTDDALDPVASTLRDALTRLDPSSRPAVALHTSGALPASVLAPLREAGLEIGGCHPIQAFSESSSLADFEGVVFGIEGDPRACLAARGLAAALGGTAIEIASESRPLYHLAAHLVAGGLVGLMAAAFEAARAAGLTDASARTALGRLARTSLETCLREGPRGALTGPVARGDLRTMEAHRLAVAAWAPERLALLSALVEEQRRLRHEPASGC